MCKERGKVWTDCTGCEKTCQTYDISCPSECTISGCVCPQGLVSEIKEKKVYLKKMFFTIFAQIMLFIYFVQVFIIGIYC